MQNQSRKSQSDYENIVRSNAKRPTNTALIRRTNQLLALLLTSLGRPIGDLLLSSRGLQNEWRSQNRNFFLRGREGRCHNDSRILNSCGPLHFKKKMGVVKNSGGISERRNVYTNLLFVLTGSSTVIVGRGDTERTRFRMRLPAGDKGSRSDKSLRSSSLLLYS